MVDHPGLRWLRDTPGGADWLQRLPGIVAECCDRWALRAGTPFEYAFASLALPVTRFDGTSAVLKVQWPDRESEQEAGALRAWDGNGTVRLLAYDEPRRALLLERCRPGTPLSSGAPAIALNVLIGLLPRLWIPPPPAVRSLEAEASGWSASLPAAWERSGRAVERRLVDAALAAIRELAPTQGEPVLVHQDLHPDNVLAAQREPWLAIDPKPLAGERAFSIACLVRAPELGHTRAAVLARLDRLCAELGLDRERARGWAIAQTMAWAFAPDGRPHAAHVETVRWLT